MVKSNLVFFQANACLDGYLGKTLTHRDSANDWDVLGKKHGINLLFPLFLEHLSLQQVFLVHTATALRLIRVLHLLWFVH